MQNAILSHPFRFLCSPLLFFQTNRNSVNMFVWNERWKWFFVDRKKDGNGREGVGDKKWQRIENRWEMKYIRTPGARSRGYDLSWHTVVPHWARGSKWGGERATRQTGEEEGKQESLRKTKEGRGPRQTRNFSWEKPLYNYQKYHPTQILFIYSTKLLLPRLGIYVIL